jgi:uncharacterized protein
MTSVRTLDELAALYGEPGETSLVKEQPWITPEYRRLIAASPFMVLATAGPEGLDCSPRGDRPGELVRIPNKRTLHLPDRRGNNRIDSLRNIIRDPRVAALFLIPGSGTTLRVNGRADISVAPDLLASFAVDGRPPRSVVVITVGTIYFQCARAVVRSGLWDPARWIDQTTLPTPGEILAATSDNTIDGAAYDAAWPGRAATSLW